MRAGAHGAGGGDQGVAGCVVERVAQGGLPRPFAASGAVKRMTRDFATQRSFTYGRPSALGATALPMKPASSTTVST